MPASNFNLYLQDARTNFDAVRPAPICDDQQIKGGYHNVHVSTNCYYGYQNIKTPKNNHVDTDCEMADVAAVHNSRTSSKMNPKKRCAEEQYCPQPKRLRDDDSSMCSLVGTRSSPSHSASAFNINIPTIYTLYLTYRLVFRLFTV